MIQGIKTGIRNLISWIPIIWNDRDWDQYYLYEILRFKLTRMEEHFRCHSHVANGPKDAKRMRLCALLLDRLIKNEYDTNSYQAVDKKWGEIELDFIDTGDDYGKVEIKREKVKNDEDDKICCKEVLNASEHARYLLKQDLDFLFDTMKKHIQTWWD